MQLETIINTIRHAKTLYNLEHRYAGSTDVPLSQQGIQDTREMAVRLSGRSFDRVITSTLQRSIETANILISKNDHFEKSDLCDERNFGLLEGLTWNEVQELDPPVLFVEIGCDQHSVNPAGGEAFEDVWMRANNFHNYLFSNYKGSNILIVSHSIFLQLFHGVLRGMNCIESLSISYPSTLDLTTFYFLENDLINEEVMTFEEIGVKSF
jgi:broad specificity phosphatase PhoE